jgi:hypothetical protein
MIFVKSERFREEVKRKHIELYIQLSSFLALITIILVGIMLFFAISSQFSEQKTVFYMLVVLFFMCFVILLCTAGHFCRKLETQEEILRARENNMSSFIMRNRQLNLNLNNIRYNNSHANGPRFEYNVNSQSVNSLNSNKSLINGRSMNSNPNLNNSNNRIRYF